MSAFDHDHGHADDRRCRILVYLSADLTDRQQ
jgi:hypothetical protein